LAPGGFFLPKSTKKQFEKPPGRAVFLQFATFFVMIGLRFGQTDIVTGVPLIGR
jgi:hypothetical protein